MALLLEFEKTKKVVMDALCSTPVWAPLNLGGNTGVNYMHARLRVIPPFYHSTQTHAKPRDLTRTHGITRNIAACQIPTRDRANLSTRDGVRTRRCETCSIFSISYMVTFPSKKVKIFTVFYRELKQKLQKVAKHRPNKNNIITIIDRYIYIQM